MKLKESFDSILFFKAVGECRGDVYFCTGEGDRLNLKSTLHQFLFSSLAGSRELLGRGDVQLEDASDRHFLLPFCRKG